MNRGISAPILFLLCVGFLSVLPQNADARLILQNFGKQTCLGVLEEQAFLLNCVDQRVAEWEYGSGKIKHVSTGKCLAPRETYLFLVGCSEAHTNWSTVPGKDASYIKNDTYAQCLGVPTADAPAWPVRIVDCSEGPNSQWDIWTWKVIQNVETGECLGTDMWFEFGLARIVPFECSRLHYTVWHKRPNDAHFYNAFERTRCLGVHHQGGQPTLWPAALTVCGDPHYQRWDIHADGTMVTSDLASCLGIHNGRAFMVPCKDAGYPNQHWRYVTWEEATGR